MESPTVVLAAEWLRSSSPLLKASIRPQGPRRRPADQDAERGGGQHVGRPMAVHLDAGHRSGRRRGEGGGTDRGPVAPGLGGGGGQCEDVAGMAGREGPAGPLVVSPV